MRPFNFDRSILISALLLVITGIFMVYSATAVMAMKNDGGGFGFLFRHVASVGVGLVAFVLGMFLDYRLLRKLSIPLLILSLLLLLLVFVPGVGISANGARRWIRMWPSTFQPSELVKLCFVIFLADYVSHPRWAPASIRRMNAAHAVRKKMENPWSGFVYPLGVLLVFQAVLIVQPDFGAFMSLGLLCLSILFLAGARFRFFLMLAPPGLAAVAYLVQAPYRLRRLTAFLDPWKDQQGSGYQLVQSLLSFGNGGLLGTGLGEGRQKLFFLPEPHTDFIFSMIGEELGFVRALLVVLLFALILYRGYRVSSEASDPFGQVLGLGLTLMIALQALFHMAVATGLLPTKGLPLPFVSYGGSSLLVSLAAVGILLSISRRRQVSTATVRRREVVRSRGRVPHTGYGNA